MLQSLFVERIGIRDLRNYASRVVRRAMAGERIVITIDGVPAAQIGPLNDQRATATVDDLIAAGLVRPPRVSVRPAPARPIPAPAGKTTIQLLLEHRDR